jgi:aldehyde:ferredoxin oxidoreductase
MIGRREGFGDILANGAQKAAEIIGRGSENYLLTIKGREIDQQPKQASYQTALFEAVCEGGPDHTRWFPAYGTNPRLLPKDLSLPYDPMAPFNPLSPEGKAPFVKYRYDRGALIEDLPTCMAMHKGESLYDLTYWLDIYNSTTGADCTAEEFLKIGERTVNLERAYIVREGFRREDDTIPRKMLEEPLIDIGLPPVGDNLDLMLDEYYTLRGWDVKTSIPTEEKLRELDLDFTIEDLKQLR